jgi:D-alanyl-D-alanine carboxypeptidase/D-alanyl-D-alanine-endopeptidase (penicillin-binding protein 4)
MQKSNHSLNPWAIVAVATLAWATPLAANEISINTDYAPSESESVEIYVPPPENNSNLSCAANLQGNIDNLIKSAPNKWGILVESVENGTVFYSHNADKYFIPASNAKLFTTAAALQRLNPEGLLRSKSIRDWINITNLRSNNYTANLLFRYLGGSGAARSSLAQVGVDPNGYRLADGSGLSRNNVATPRALVTILKVMNDSPQRDIFYASLPVAGVSGTLRNRMRQTPAQGMVLAKTGTLSGVRALSGYMNHPDYGLLVFSIIANSPGQGQSLVQTIDKIVLQVSMSSSCN